MLKYVNLTLKEYFKRYSFLLYLNEIWRVYTTSIMNLKNPDNKTNDIEGSVIT